MINPETGEIVPYGETRRVYRTDEGSLVLLLGIVGLWHVARRAPVLPPYSMVSPPLG
jgi:hypothetical protein